METCLRPLSPTSLSSAVSAFKRFRNDIVEGYCSLLASISFNSNLMSYTCQSIVYNFRKKSSSTRKHQLIYTNIHRMH